MRFRLLMAATIFGLAACSSQPRVIIKREIVYVEPPGRTRLPPPPRVQPKPEKAGKPSPQIDQVIAAARKHIGKRRVRVNGKSFRFDCSGFVRGVFSAMGLKLFSLGSEYRRANGVRLIFHFIERYGRNHRDAPKPGDVVYFDDTYDKNGNGRLDDPLTHIGLVDSVDPDGTFHVIHRTSRGIVREPMNLKLKSKRRDKNKKIVNGYLRRKRRRDPPGTPYLMGQLFAGFGTVPAEQPLLSLLVNYLVWQDLL